MCRISDIYSSCVEKIQMEYCLRNIYSDLRVVRTKEAIRDAFVELMEEKATVP